jgi:hypothetical protein
MLDEDSHSATKPKKFPTMKTTSLRSSFAALAVTLALGAFAAVAFAGPGPQYWNKAPSPVPAAKSVTASACGGCSDTTQWKISDRGPSGKGVPGASVASRTHGCTNCSGEVVSTPNQTKDTMTRAATCGTMMCCK